LAATFDQPAKRSPRDSRRVSSPAFFDLPTFFRRVSNSLLGQFFANTPAFPGFDWNKVTARRIEPILQRFNEMDPNEPRSAFGIFRRADSLASSIGTQVLIEVSRGKGLDLGSKLAGMSSAYDRAFWMCLGHPEVI
jgi:hypothetical protein